MFKVFESFDFMEAGRVQSLLEAHGIETFMKNEFSTGALGELPFVEVAPMVFVVNEKDLVRAVELVRQDQEGEAALQAADEIPESRPGSDPDSGDESAPGPAAPPDPEPDPA